jgi:type IV pilus assembly protein PilZ
MSDQPGKVVRLKFKDKNALYQSYMSFVKDGGLYVPTKLDHTMDVGKPSPVFLLVELPESNEIFPACGKTCWVNDGRKKGVGVRFATDERTKILRIAIENILAANLQSTTQTLTM